MLHTSEFSTDLISSLHETLTDLNRHPYPHVPSPESCKKRASVALVLRVRPDFNHWPPQSPFAPDPQATASPIELIDRFFDQEWVRNGDPEIVFIKRAARGGDRWSSHSAFPGGKRDPEDENDKEVAIRETSEEIGLDLKSPSALYIGNLPERVVSTSWGKVPIMVLCPFVFLWTQPDMPPLKLQPTEVASTHWVPLRVLLSPSTRTFEYVDVSDRFARRGGKIMKFFLRPVLGKMRFSAIRLLPSETLRCTSTAEYFSQPTQSNQRSWGGWVYNLYKGNTDSSPLIGEKPLLLWGLTLGMLADLLEQLPPHNAIELWSHPTFTSPDVRWIVTLLTHSLKQRNVSRLGSNSTAVDSETEAVASGEDSWFVGEPANGKPLRKGNNKTQTYAVGVMLDGYYDLMRKGVWIAAAGRLFATVFFIACIVRRFRRHTS
ncbi:nudix family hydrolase-like protein [Halenospora varia]|nr:nudix family hydrolase-like protein [Halenospora varia]